MVSGESGAQWAVSGERRRETTRLPEGNPLDEGERAELVEVDGAREAAVDPRDEGGDLAAARVDVVGPRVGDDAVEREHDGAGAVGVEVEEVLERQQLERHAL